MGIQEHGRVVLVTSFLPFHGDAMNSSTLAATGLPDAFCGYVVKHVVLPVSDEAVDQIARCLAELKPEIVLMLGQAAGRNKITVERIAINCDDYAMADEAGKQTKNQKIVVDGPDGIFASMPYEKIVNDLLKNGIDAEISNTAGTFLCNHVFYYVRYHYPGVMAGFIHVPVLYEQDEASPVSRQVAHAAILRAMQVCIKEAS